MPPPPPSPDRLTHLPQGVVVLDPSGIVVEANPAALRLLDLTPVAIGSLTHLALAGRLVRADGSPLPPGRLSPGGAVEGEVLRPSRGGEAPWLTVQALPLEGNQTLLTFTEVTALVGRDREAARSAERLRTMVLHAPVAVGVCDLGGRVDYLNHAFVRLFGYDQVDLPHLDAWWPLAFPDPDLRERARGAWMAAAQEAFEQGGSTRPMTFPMTCKGGRVVEVELVGACTGEDWIVMFTDITERLHAQEALRESEARFRAIFETEPECVKLVAPDGTLLAMNPAGLEMLEVDSPEQALGKPITNWVATPYQVGFQQLARRVFAGERQRAAFEIIGERGTRRWMETHAAPWRNAAGEVEALLAVTRDITAQKQAVDALRESEARLRLIMEYAPDFILQLDRAGRILYINRLVAGHRWEEIEGRSWLNWIPAEDQPAAQGAMDRALASGEPQDYVGRGPGPNETTAHHMAKLAPIVGPQGVEGFILLSRDVTADRRAAEERQELERELEHLQRLESVGRLAGGIAHDMNNVLAAIMSVGSLVRERHREDPETCHQADTLLKAAARGRDLVKGLTDFARKGLRDAAVLDLNDLVRREAELLGSTTLKRVTVAMDLAPGPLRLRGEASALANVLMNLCVNALDAMPDGGTLTLRTRALPGEAELQVEDTGEGMPPEVRARAIEPFFTTKPVGKGTGLGLSVVFGTVKAHGGQLEIESAPGRGTRILVRLPAWEEDAPAEPTPPEPTASRRLRILVVDDEPLIRDTLPPMLEALGHQVRAAASGAEGLQQLGHGPELDLLILDLNMPEMGGLETLRRLRPDHPRLPVLISTGFQDASAAEVLAADPLTSVLMKPFSLSEIRRALEPYG